MTEARHVDYGYTVQEAIDLIPGELPIDAVGLWQIVPKARDGFGLKGHELTDFVRRSIHALLDAGAVPVRHQPGSEFEWDMQNQYGTSRDAITEGVIREWLAMPDDSTILCGEGVWFARPRIGRKYVKID